MKSKLDEIAGISLFFSAKVQRVRTEQSDAVRMLEDFIAGRCRDDDLSRCYFRLAESVRELRDELNNAPLPTVPFDWTLEGVIQKAKSTNAPLNELKHRIAMNLESSRPNLVENFVGSLELLKKEPLLVEALFSEWWKEAKARELSSHPNNERWLSWGKLLAEFAIEVLGVDGEAIWLVTTKQTTLHDVAYRFEQIRKALFAHVDAAATNEAIPLTEGTQPTRVQQGPKNNTKIWPLVVSELEKLVDAGQPYRTYDVLSELMTKKLGRKVHKSTLTKAFENSEKLREWQRDGEVEIGLIQYFQGMEPSSENRCLSDSEVHEAMAEIKSHCTPDQWEATKSMDKGKLARLLPEYLEKDGLFANKLGRQNR